MSWLDEEPKRLIALSSVRTGLISLNGALKGIKHDARIFESMWLLTFKSKKDWKKAQKKIKQELTNQKLDPDGEDIFFETKRSQDL